MRYGLLVILMCCSLVGCLSTRNEQLDPAKNKNLVIKHKGKLVHVSTASVKSCCCCSTKDAPPLSQPKPKTRLY